MATVYRARDRRLDREVAVKIIHRHLRENWEVAQRFDSEARAVAKLKHANIVEVYDVSDADEDERYLVVELVRGTTLRKLLANEGYLPPEIAAIIGVELADALDHAHGLGVIHRDVKPENVLIAGPDSEREVAPVKITDFGIAKLLDAQGVTSTGQVLGSPAHMAPEQIEGGDVSARADVFGLGVLLYECMVGKLPFDGKNPAQVLRRVLDGSFVPAERARATIGAAFSAILSRALAHDANDRFASAAELKRALQGELELSGYTALNLELRAFLAEPATYRREHEARIVSSLVERARAARERRDVPLAAACYNRALAYRPDDPELIASVSNLARGVKTRRLLRGLALSALGVVLTGSAALALARSLARQRAELPQPSTSTKPAPSAAPVLAPPPATAASATTAASAKEVAPAVASAEPPAVTATAAPRRRPGRPTTKVTPAEAEPLDRKARVQVVVSGPQNATVRIDGADTPWFGKIQELEPGEHTFEFVAPNEQCCLPGKTMKVRVPPSASPDDVHIVQGRIEFRPATLDLRGPPGSSASCGPLGEFPVPSQHAIPLTSAERRVRCQLLPPPGSAEPPKEFDVTLRPGRLSTNLGQ